jgi:hypothetical protein
VDEEKKVKDFANDNDDDDDGNTFDPHPCTIRVHTTCLRPHMMYKTVRITPRTTSKEVIMGLLTRFRMTHRDPKLFYLTMEVTVNQECQTISLEDNSRPSDLISCNPWGDCKFILCSKMGGVVKIYDHHIRTDSVYKSLIISRDTTVRDTLTILRSYYHSLQCMHLTLGEECAITGRERILQQDQHPLQVMEAWHQDTQYRLVLRFNKEYEKRNLMMADEGSMRVADPKSGRKMESLRVNKFKHRHEEEMRPVVCRTVHINIYSDTVYDTDSNDSELDISEEEEYMKELKDSSMSISEEEDSTHEGCVIIESFFT